MRVVIALDENGEFDGYVSDEPIELIIHSSAMKGTDEEFYHYKSGHHGVEKVRKVLGDSAIAYGGEDFLYDHNGSKPTIKSVK